MKKVLKWFSIIIGGLAAVLVLAIFIVPMFINVRKYKPEIENFAAQAMNRPVAIKGNIDLSLFPWVGLSFSDLHIGNPAGFQEKDFVVVKAFEARVKVLPLLSKKVQVKRFVVEQPRIFLEKRKDGRGNWEGLGNASGKPRREQAKKGTPPKAGEASEGLPIQSLAVEEFAVTNGRILWIDDAQAERREISDLNLRLQDVSLDRAIHLALSANLDKQPISLKGDVGPLGKSPGKGSIPLNLTIKAFNQLEVDLKGSTTDPASTQAFDLTLQIPPFSPRKLMAALGKPLPVATTDPKALTSVALKARLTGDPGSIRISDGRLDLDESKMAFSLQVQEFAKPDVAFNVELDKINVDRYLPPPSEKNPRTAEEKTPPPDAMGKKTDYAPLRQLVLDGTLKIATLTAKGLTIQDVNARVTGKNGLFKLDPLSMKLYKGSLSANGAFDVRQDTPQSRAKLDADGIQAGPFVKDFMKKEIVEGTLQLKADLRMEGDGAERIKRSLNGQGDLLFKDGAIVGIDLAGMVRNAAATFGLAAKGQEKPKTDFAELLIPFTATDGRVKTADAKLLSPLLRVAANGSADLVKESLDFRIEPKFVGTLKGQGDTTARSGVMVPVLVSGTFSAPRFRPDLESLLKQGIPKELPKASDLLKGLGPKGTESKELQEKANKLLKGLPFGK